jgi:hypothetical protein
VGGAGLLKDLRYVAASPQEVTKLRKGRCMQHQVIGYMGSLALFCGGSQPLVCSTRSCGVGSSSVALVVVSFPPWKQARR